MPWRGSRGDPATAHRFQGPPGSPERCPRPTSRPPGARGPAHLGCACDHVLDEVAVARGVDDGDVVLGGLEFPEGDVDGDAALPLGFQLVQHPGVLEGALPHLEGWGRGSGRDRDSGPPGAREQHVTAERPLATAGTLGLWTHLRNRGHQDLIHALPGPASCRLNGRHQQGAQGPGSSLRAALVSSPPLAEGFPLSEARVPPTAPPRSLCQLMTPLGFRLSNQKAPLWFFGFF